MATAAQNGPAAGAILPGVDRALRADARRNREAVIAAAKRLFSDLGLDAQMPDVARSANVGVGTVYRHFPTKDHLIAALVAERFERFAQKAREGVQAEDPWEGLAELIRFAVQIQADDRGLCEVMGSRPDIMDAAARAAGLPELSEELVKRAQRSGQLRGDLEWEDIPMIACGLGSITQATAGPAVGRWPRLVEIMLDGLRAPGSAKLPRPPAVPADTVRVPEPA
ncbi:MAG: TetR/AcrR family transcriptional regulator [Solirubrobacterales bacterium]|nr:TetR/AcrR family transcriptional regulator [Solirubrobacterales bacterium]